MNQENKQKEGKSDLELCTTIGVLVAVVSAVIGFILSIFSWITGYEVDFTVLEGLGAPESFGQVILASLLIALIGFIVGFVVGLLIILFGGRED